MKYRSDADKEKKTAPIWIGALSLLTLIWLLLFHVFHNQIHDNVRHSATAGLGLVLQGLSIAWLWIGYRMDAEGKSYMWAWGILLTIGSLLSYGFDNM